MTERIKPLVVGGARRRSRIVAIVGVLLLFVATGAVAAAIWPERTQHHASRTNAGNASQPAQTAVGAGPASAAAPSGESTDAPTGLGGATNLRFALQPVTGALP